MAGKKVREGMRVPGYDENGLKDLPPAQSLRGLVVFIFHMVFCPDVCRHFFQTLTSCLLVFRVRGSRLGENLSKGPIGGWGGVGGNADWISLRFPSSAGDWDGDFCRGDAGSNFHAEVHAGAPARESPSSMLPKTSAAWSGA